MHDELFLDFPADLVHRHVSHSYGSTTALYVAMRDELDIGGDDA